MSREKQCFRMRLLQRKMSFQSNRDRNNAIQLIDFFLVHYPFLESPTSVCIWVMFDVHSGFPSSIDPF